MVALGQTETGARIKAAREGLGWNQPQLAHAIGLKHPQSISNYERGLTDVPATRLRKIAEATGRPLSYFVDEPNGDGGEAKPPQTLEQILLALDAQQQQIAELSAAVDDLSEGVRAIAEHLVPARRVPARQRRAG